MLIEFAVVSRGRRHGGQEELTALLARFELLEFFAIFPRRPMRTRVSTQELTGGEDRLPMRRFVRFHGSLRAVLVLGSALAVFGGWELAAPIRGQIVRAAGRPPRGRYPWRSPCRDALHDANLDKYIQPFRDCFPVVANELTPSSDPSESVAASKRGLI